jgi:hypothetical protein
MLHPEEIKQKQWTGNPISPGRGPVLDPPGPAPTFSVANPVSAGKYFAPGAWFPKWHSEAFDIL